MENNFWKQLRTQSAVRLFREILELRSYYASSGEQVSMIEVWEDLASTEFEDVDEFKTKINFFHGDEKTDRKAAVIVFASRIKLIVSDGFWRLAQRRNILQNFQLAHEYMHVVLDHHARGAVVKNFKLDTINGVNANIPPNWEEFEANIAAVFFQCGTALFEKDKSAHELAKKFCADDYYVKRLQRLCQSRVFQDEYEMQEASRPRRVVL